MQNFADNLDMCMCLIKHDFVLVGYGEGEGDYMATPEGKIKTKVNARLKDINPLWKFMPVSMGYGLPSLDYLLCVNGYFVAIETKAPGKKPTPRQEHTIGIIRAAGGIVFIVDSDATLDECIGSIIMLTRATRPSAT